MTRTNRHPHDRYLVALAALAVAAAVLFIACPQLDISFSRAFYTPEGGFAADHDPTVRILRRLWILSAWVLIAGAGVLLLVSIVTGRVRIAGIGRTALVFFLLVQALGPGLLANAVLKDHWGRARPSQVTEFGGAMQQTPPVLIANQCRKNCSFIGGEAAYAFSFMALGFLPGPARRRRAWLVCGALFGIVVSGVRIAQGGHFLSDCLFSAILMLGTGWAVHALIFRLPLPTPLARWLRAGATA